TETDAACQTGRPYESSQFILVSPLPDFLFADERGFIRCLGFAFLSGQHLPGTEELDGFSVYRVVEGNSPEHTLSLLLTPGTELGRERLKGRANFREINMKRHVATDDLTTMDGKACFERFGIKQTMGRLRLPVGG